LSSLLLELCDPLDADMILGESTDPKVLDVEDLSLSKLRGFANESASSRRLVVQLT
jgi:hypothetical protein